MIHINTKRNRNPKTLRIWVHLNSPKEIYNNWAKITLEPNVKFELPVTGGPDEEGHSYTYASYCWYPDEREVVREVHTYASDCDGPIEYHNITVCPVDRINRDLKGAELNWITGENPMKVKQREWEHDARPVWAANGNDWRSRKSWQRDHSAEAMNY